MSVRCENHEIYTNIYIHIYIYIYIQCGDVHNFFSIIAYGTLLLKLNLLCETLV